MVLIRLPDGHFGRYELVETARGLRIQSGFNYVDLSHAVAEMDWHIVAADEGDRAILTRHNVPFGTKPTLRRSHDE